MRIEPAEWSPGATGHSHGRLASESLGAVRNMRIGEVIRLYHDDLKCLRDPNKGNRYACSLPAMIVVLRKQGYKLEYYHEKPQVAIIRRLG